MNHNNTTENSNSNNSPFELTLDETLIWEGRPCVHLLMRKIWIKCIFGSSLILILAYLWKVGMPISIQKYIPDELLSFITSAPWVSSLLFVFGLANAAFPLLHKREYNNTRYIITNKRIALISASKEVMEWEKDDFLNQAQLTQHSKDWVSLTLWHDVDDRAHKAMYANQAQLTQHSKGRASLIIRHGINDRAHKAMYVKIGLEYIPSDVYDEIKH